MVKTSWMFLFQMLEIKEKQEKENQALNILPPFHIAPEKFKNAWNPFTLRQKSFKTQSPIILDLKKTQAGKSFYDFGDVLVKSSGLKYVAENAPFSWRISVDRRPNRRNKSCVFKFLPRSVDVAFFWSLAWLFWVIFF